MAVELSDVVSLICSHCSCALDPEVLYCRECRKLLVEDDGDTPIPEEDERILLLAQGCELLQTGEWELGAFRHWLQEFISEQARREIQIAEVYQSIPIGLEEEFQEEIDMGFAGVSAVNEALTLLAEYDPDTCPAEALKRSLALYYKGVCVVKEAMNINRRNRGRPLWI